MYYVEDENFARRLQYELQAYENFSRQKKEKENSNPVDSKLEYIDPTPSIHDLFVRFDKKFFWNSLGMVEVVWSSKMTLCAGVCSFEGGKGLCKIALSAPLLSLRPRKDLVETLLHEMIHAFLFVTHNKKDREDHGPEFRKHMHRINKEAGTNITIFHSFFNEVEYYQRHVWRCNGPCQTKKPYFGFLRRAVNRPPGPKDPWWNQHKVECGGTYIKIAEPEKRPKKKKVDVAKPKDRNKDIRDYFNTSPSKGSQKVTNIKTLSDLKIKSVTGIKPNFGTGTVTITNTKEKSQKAVTKNPKNEKLNKKSVKNKTNKTYTSGKVKTAKEKEPISSQASHSADSEKIRENVRSVWAGKFSKSKAPVQEVESKKLKLQCPVCSKGLSEEKIQNHVEECLINESFQTLKAEISNCEKPDEYKNCSVCSQKVLQSEMNDHLEGCLNCTFVNEGDKKHDNEILCESVPCPCCYKWFQESEMNSHIDECLTLNTLKAEILSS